jgi:hypothetical protein
MKRTAPVSKQSKLDAAQTLVHMSESIGRIATDDTDNIVTESVCCLCKCHQNKKEILTNIMHNPQQTISFIPLLRDKPHVHARNHIIINYIKIKYHTTKDNRRCYNSATYSLLWE